MKNIFLASIVTIAVATNCSNNASTEVETWRMTELSFISATNYDETGADSVMMDVTFVNKTTNDTIVRPAFWDGSNLFLVRFAPTAKGKWVWTTRCAEDASLDGKKGTLSCRNYKGDLDIYKHGFVKAIPGRKFLAYADSTPFFYLGDTHWSMLTEEFDEPGGHAGNTGAVSHFKYIVDRRVEQGFTVYQSEPIGAKFHLTDGHVDKDDIAGFRDADRYYQYIADKGLVHANAELFFPGDLNAKIAFDNKVLERLSRYWVARFGAYPVMWTLAQEIDNDFYHENGQNLFDFNNNPWVKVAEYIHKYDSYGHPLSGHQESAVKTTVTGFGANDCLDETKGRSVFFSKEVAEKTGHNWWAAQWSPPLAACDDSISVDYWNSERPAVNYEGKYCGFWTKNFGSRAQGWISFLSGFCGYGYGAIDIWYYNGMFELDLESYDGVDTVTKQDKMTPWAESIEYESANQMIFLRKFMESFDWWNLVPVFHGSKDFEQQTNAYAYARTKDRHVFYFYGKNTGTGIVKGLKPGQTFSLSWFNPRNGQETDGLTKKDAQTSKKSETLTCVADENGSLQLPEREDSKDWVLTLCPTNK